MTLRISFFPKIKKTGSKTPSTSDDDPHASVDQSRSRKGKVPKRINKAVRERLKREHLNELFIELADTLEMNQQNSGKASILCEATKFLKDVFGQIESLRKEQTALLSESNYLTTEKNELKEETSVLETEISRLHSEIEARVNQSKPDLNTSPAPDCLSTIINSIPNLHLSVQDSLFSKEPAFNNLLQLLLVPRLLSFQCILISRHKILQT